MDRIRSHFFNYCNCGGEHNNQLAIAQHLKDWYLERRADQWTKPNKKNTDKIAPIKKGRGES